MTPERRPTMHAIPQTVTTNLRSWVMAPDLPGFPGASASRRAVGTASPAGERTILLGGPRAKGPRPCRGWITFPTLRVIVCRHDFRKTAIPRAAPARGGPYPGEGHRSFDRADGGALR